MNPVAQWLSRRLLAHLTRRRHVHTASPEFNARELARTLRAGDVLLVEGDNRISTAIKYLTQSTWSHAALYLGVEAIPGQPRGQAHCFVEADAREGIRSVGLNEFDGMNCRICRPRLTEDDRRRLTTYALGRLGQRYDLKNVVDLARYLLPVPPVPRQWRRRMLALGSGDPTRAICSTFIAQAFQSVRYPILPVVTEEPGNDPRCPGCLEEIWHIRHHSLFVPRDFDISPYFQVVKPGDDQALDYRALKWGKEAG